MKTRDIIIALKLDEKEEKICLFPLQVCDPGVHGEDCFCCLFLKYQFWQQYRTTLSVIKPYKSGQIVEHKRLVTSVKRLFLPKYVIRVCSLCTGSDLP